MSLCCQITKRRVQKLECKLKNLKTYSNGCGIKQLGTTSLPIKTIVMASEVVYKDDLVFKNANGITKMTITQDGVTLDGNISGTFTGDLNGNVNGGNINGNMFGPLTGPVTGNVTGNVVGDLTGDVTGDVFGNVTGSLFAQLNTNVVRLPNVSNIGIISGQVGSIVMDTADGYLKYYDGTSWKTLAIAI